MAQRLAWKGPVVLLTVAVLASMADLKVAAQPVAPGQGFPPGAQPGQPAAQSDPNLDLAGVSLPRNSRLESQLQAAQEYAQTKNWQEATSILQRLLELPEDVLVSRGWASGENANLQSMVSIRQEANRLVAGLPKEGKEFYQLNYGALAAAMLKEAKDKASAAILGDILRIYLHTQAGAEAANLLGTYQLDRGNYLSASLCFEKLIDREGIGAVASTALIRASLAFHLAGDLASRDKVYAQLRQRGLREVKVLGEAVNLDDWRGQVNSMARAPEAGVNDWLMVGGNPKRNASTQGGTAFLEPNWRKSTVRYEESKALLSPAIGIMHDRQNPLIPGMIPLSETVVHQGRTLPLVIYRSNWGIHAVNSKTGELEWESQNEWSVDGMMKPKLNDTARRRQAVQEWMDAFARVGGPRAGIALENTVTGTLSSDGVRVYGVNDLQVPPNSMGVSYGVPVDPTVAAAGRHGTEIGEAISANRLRAYNLVTGKLVWEIGGKKESAPGDKGIIDLSDSHFTGTPLPIAGRLYVLNEKQQEIRLLTLDPETGKPLASQTLVTTRDRLSMDIPRKTQAAHLAYGDGILVCPTNAGAILGVDLLTGSLVWSFLYREQAQDGLTNQDTALGRRQARLQLQMMGGFPGMGGMPAHSCWHSAPPMISGDKIIFTSPNARSLFCLNLKSGVKIWSQPRTEDDVYLGGIHAGKVLVVGKHAARGIDLQTGLTAWTVETGMPSGYGAASGSLYFLPLKESAKTKEPEICTIDMKLGKVTAHTHSRKKEIPGNLVFYQGDVLSQGPMDLAVYSQLAVRLAYIDEKIRANPNDPEGLADRGELRLDKGDIEGAIADLDLSLRNKPTPQVTAKARKKLFEAFTEAFQENFTRFEPMIGRFEEMCARDTTGGPVTEAEQAEANQRRTVFLGLMARGRETQGRLLDAAKEYDRLAELAAPGSLFTPNDDSALRITPDALARGRIKLMIASAKPEMRQQLEAYLESRLESLKRESLKQESLKTSSDRKDHYKNFTLAFGPFFPGGRKTAAELTRDAAQENGTMPLLEAERFLGAYPGLIPSAWSSSEAAQALDSQAILYQNRGLLPDAASLLSELARRFPNENVRPGMNSARLFNDLAADRRFLPYLAEPATINATGPIKVVEDRSSSNSNHRAVTGLYREGAGLPFFDRNQFVLINNPNQPSSLVLKGTSMTNGESWELPLSGPNVYQHLIGAQPGAKRLGISYQTSGHLMILWVANWIYAIDPIRHKVLWETNLLQGKSVTTFTAGNERFTRPNYNGNNISLDANDGLLYLTREDGWKQRIGMVGTIVDGVLPVLNSEGLAGLDPMSGKVLWSRSDVRSDHLLLGASDSHLFLARTSTDGAVNGSRAVRAIDGYLVDQPDFSKDYRNRLVLNGSRLLSFEAPAATEKTAKTGPVLKLIDLLGNQEIFRKEFPVGTRSLESVGGNLGGVVLPDGNVEVFQLPDGKALPVFKINPILSEKAPMALIADGANVYLVSQKPEDQGNIGQGVQTNFMGWVGLRFVRANGDVYAFRRESGKLAWRNSVSNQLMILDQFQNLPMVLFSSRFQQFQRGPGAQTLINLISTKGYDKRTGKLILDKETRTGQQFFHAFLVDLRAGRLDLLDGQNRISFFWGSGLALADSSRPNGGPTATTSITSENQADSPWIRVNAPRPGAAQGNFIAPAVAPAAVPARRAP